MAWTLKHDRTLHVALLSYYEDAVIGTAFNGLDAVQYKALLLRETDKIAAAYAERFKRFMLPGAKHVLTFELPTLAADGLQLSAWLQALSAGDWEQWQDVLVATP